MRYVKTNVVNYLHSHEGHNPGLPDGQFIGHFLTFTTIAQFQRVLAIRKSLWPET